MGIILNRTQLISFSIFSCRNLRSDLVNTHQQLSDRRIEITNLNSQIRRFCGNTFDQ